MTTTRTPGPGGALNVAIGRRPFERDVEEGAEHFLSTIGANQRQPGLRFARRNTRPRVFTKGTASPPSRFPTGVPLPRDCHVEQVRGIDRDRPTWYRFREKLLCTNVIARLFLLVVEE